MCSKVFATVFGILLFLVGYVAGFLYRDMFDHTDNTDNNDIDFETEYDYNSYYNENNH